MTVQLRDATVSPGTSHQEATHDGIDGAINLVNTQRSLVAIWTAGFIALVLRLTWAMAVLNTPIVDPAQPMDQGSWWTDVNSIAHGHGMTSTRNPPGYPYIMGKMVGLGHLVGITNDRLLPSIIQALLGAAVVVAMGLLARRRISSRMGVAVAILMTCALSPILGTGALMSEGLAVPLFVGAMVAFFWHEEPSRLALRTSGVLLGVSVLTRPAALPVAFFVLGLLWHKKDGWANWQRVGNFLLPWLLILGANGIRMDMQGYPAWVIDTNAWSQACIGHNDVASGRWVDSPRCLPLPDEEPLAAESRMRDEAATWAIHHPRSEVRLAAMRILTLSTGDDEAMTYYPSYTRWDVGVPQRVPGMALFFWNTIFTLLAVCGFLRVLFRGWRCHWGELSKAHRRLMVGLGVWGFGVMILPLIFVASSRYRLPVDAILTIAVAWEIAHPGRVLAWIYQAPCTAWRYLFSLSSERVEA